MKNAIKNRRTLRFDSKAFSGFSKDFQIVSKAHDYTTLKSLSSKIKKPENIFKLTNQVYFNPKIVRQNIRRANQQTFSFPSKKLKELLRLNEIESTQVLDLNNALILYRASQLFNLPPLIFLAEEMQTPIEYACNEMQIDLADLHKETDYKKIRERILICNKHVLGSLKALAKHLQVEQKRVYEYLNDLERGNILSALAKVFYPSMLWIWFYGIDDIELIDNINAFYTKEIVY